MKMSISVDDCGDVEDMEGGGFQTGGAKRCLDPRPAFLQVVRRRLLLYCFPSSKLEKHIFLSEYCQAINNQAIIKHNQDWDSELRMTKATFYSGLKGYSTL